MRPIGSVEHKITMEAVRLTDASTAALKLMLRQVGLGRVTRKAIRRVLRVRGEG